MNTDIRSQFDLPRDICYLKAAYMTPQPIRVLQAAIRGAENRAHAWQVAPTDFFDQVEALRSAFARLLACSPENIAIVPSASYGIATAANNIKLDPSESVMVLADQFPSNYYSWQRLAETAEGEVSVANKRDKQDWASSILEHLHEDGTRTRVAALANHHWATCESIDLVAICEELHKLGSQIVLDLTQTVGACPVDVGGLDPDFAVIAGYKWLFCPYGVSFLYVADRQLDGTPIEETWAGRYGSEDFSQLAAYTDRYQAGARRFDMGERASFSNVSAAIEALEMVREWDVRQISNSLREVNIRISSIFAEHGFETLDANDRAPHMQSVRRPNTDTRSIATRLADNGVLVSQRGDRLRIAPHLYTDAEDLARLDETLGVAMRNRG
jgi:selenocysteine lyase/cysteine desulfurase